MRVMIGGALCLLAAAPARAGVAVAAGVPFTAAQLEAAILARGGPGEGALEISVSRPGPDRLALVTPAGQWEIDIGPASGEAAARVVALHVLDLGASVPPVAPQALAAIPAAGVQAPAPPRKGVPYRVAALGLGSRGFRAGDFTLAGGAIELTGGTRWIAGGQLAWQHGLTIDRAPGAPISADLFRARVVAGVALGPVELVAGGFAGSAIVDGATGGVTGLSTGLVAEARIMVPVSGAWSILVAAGAEVFRQRIEVRFGDVPIGATPRAALGGGVGLAWTGGPAT